VHGLYQEGWLRFVVGAHPLADLQGMDPEVLVHLHPARLDEVQCFRPHFPRRPPESRSMTRLKVAVTSIPLAHSDTWETQGRCQSLGVRREELTMSGRTRVVWR